MLYYISENAFPAYIALSTDISGCKLEGVSHVGKTVYCTDTKAWYIITGSNLYLEAFVYPKLET